MYYHFCVTKQIVNEYQIVYKIALKTVLIIPSGNFNGHLVFRPNSNTVLLRTADRQQVELYFNNTAASRCDTTRVAPNSLSLTTESRLLLTEYCSGKDLLCILEIVHKWSNNDWSSNITA